MFIGAAPHRGIRNCPARVDIAAICPKSGGNTYDGYMKRDEDYALLSRLLDEGLDRPREDRRRWLEQLPPAHAMLKPQLTRMLLTQLRDEAGDLMAVAKLLRAALLD